MAGRLKTGLVAYGLSLQLALPLAAQDFQIRDGYIPIDFLEKKPGIHYFLRVEAVGMPSDNFYNIMIDAERLDIPGLAISGLEPGAPYKIFRTECNADGDCTELGGYLVREARARK